MNNIELYYIPKHSSQSYDGYVINEGTVHSKHFTGFNSVLKFKCSLKNETKLKN